MSFDSAASAEAQLVAAAKEEAAAALQLADEAERLADKITDPAKKQLIKKAIQEVKMCARKVVECAELVSQNPNDPVAQQKLSAAQKDLGNAIQRVVNLTSGTSDRELSDAMAEMKSETDGGADNVLFRAAQEVLDDISNMFNNKKMSPEQTIAAAKELSAKAHELAKQLREMAAKTNDPVYKEKLLNAAKIIKDGAIQIKILSAVRAAGGEDKGNSVAMGAKQLQTNIQEILKVVRAEGLRTKFSQTVKQTMAINKVVKAWRKHSTK